VIVDVPLVHPGWPLEQLPVAELSREMLQDTSVPQVPGQDVPQAVEALLK
jgi:hypothetical protein